MNRLWLLRAAGDTTVKFTLLMVFDLLGWVTLHPVTAVGGVIVTAAILAVVFAALTVAAALLSGCTCGVSLLLIPLTGALVLKLVLLMTPKAITMSSSLLAVILVGSCLSLVSLPFYSKNKGEDEDEPEPQPQPADGQM